VDFFLSVITGHLCSSPVCAELFDCYVLSVRHLLSISGFFPLCYGFFLSVITGHLSSTCSVVLTANVVKFHKL